MTKEHLRKYAQVMVWAMEDARKNTGKGAVYTAGENVILKYQPSARLLAENIYPILLRKGLNVVLEPLAHYEMEKIFFDGAGENQLKFVGSWRRELYRNTNGYIYLYAPDSLTHLKDCDSDKMATRSLALKELRDIWDECEFAGKFGWTLSMMPTSALAKQAKMSEIDYALEIIKACYLDEEDPVAKWTDTMAKISKIKGWLNRTPIEYVHVKSEDGRTDLKVWIGEERQWLGGSGHNIPSFEIFVSPEAGRAEGKYYADGPSFKMGHYVEGVHLEFRDGVVVHTTAEREEEFVQSRVNLDEGSKMIGEFSLTDKRFSKITRFMASTLYDENFGGENGNCHIAIGKAYLDAYAGEEEMTPELANKLKFSDSAEHWDLVTTTPRTVTAYLKDGSSIVIYGDGMFTHEL